MNSIEVMYTSIFYCMKHEELYILSVRPSSFCCVLVPKNIRFTCFERSAEEAGEEAKLEA